MDIKLIKSLVSLFEGSELSDMEISETEGENTFKVSLKKGEKYIVSDISAPIKATHVPAVGKPAGDFSEGVVDFNRLSDIKSPMVGIFYTASSPDVPPFVSRGSKVKKGDTLCIIEAMKLMNEVVAEVDGEIVEVVAKNGELVEFGQILFRIL